MHTHVFICTQTFTDTRTQSSITQNWPAYSAESHCRYLNGFQLRQANMPFNQVKASVESPWRMTYSILSHYMIKCILQYGSCALASCRSHSLHGTVGCVVYHYTGYIIMTSRKDQLLLHRRRPSLPEFDPISRLMSSFRTSSDRNP
jgi:hypothetical protein